MTVQEHLNQIDYSFKDYIPSQESLQVLNFIKIVNGGREENESPLVHCMMIDKIISPSSRVAIMASRGLSKSSLIEYLVLYLACFEELGSIKKPKFMLYIASDMERNAKKFRTGIEFKYANSPYLQELIPNKTIKMLVNDNGNESEIVNDKDIGGRIITDLSITFINKNKVPLKINMFGVKTGIRGTKEFNVRPSLCVADDLIQEADAKSEALLTQIEDVMYHAVPYALHPTRQKIVWLGTPFNESDPLYKSIESGRWDSLVLPICEKFPCAKEEFKGAWEDRFPYSAVKQFYDDALARGNANGFYQELMMSVINEDNILIKKDCIIYLDDKGSTHPSSMYNYYITTDLAVSTKESADNSVISVWAYTSNQDFILVDGFCGKVLVDEFMNHLFRLTSKYKPLQVGIEVTGQQAGFIQWILNEQYKKNIFFDIKEIRPNKDKYSRFLTFAPNYHRKKIKFSSMIKGNTAYHSELVNELSKVTVNDGFKSKHDDVLDTHSMLQYLDLYAPSYETIDEVPTLKITPSGYYWDVEKPKNYSRNNYI